ncbi:OsmC family protein [Stappia sp. F7233]|uniref:OsmC family protein n=1 Tax=Stappia albiluteola TaxID=2758565 RepID=A0A839AKC2_9HYPH|nr:OsmC family protein [Stappia albiluteola]MBA5779454.1 OsmC family protein [Stappia albiluteola]
MTAQSAVVGKTTYLNGIDTKAAADTIAAIKNDKSLAKFQFRATNEWVSGGENRSTIRDFFGAGMEDTSRAAAFTFTNGEPPVLLGNNEGANPVEFLLHALAGCVTTTFVLHAMARGIAIQELSTELKGNIDLQGLLGLDDSVPPGYERIDIVMHVKADCSDEELEDLMSYAQQHSPVCNTVCRPVPVTVTRAMR